MDVAAAHTYAFVARVDVATLLPDIRLPSLWLQRAAPQAARALDDTARKRVSK